MAFTMENPRVKLFKETLLRFDYSLAVATLMLATMGVVMIYTATKEKLMIAGLNPSYYLERQSLFVVLGAIVMLVVSTINYRKLLSISYLAYGATIVALLGVLTSVGKRALGSQRWYQFGPFQFQPSEFATIALVVSVAYYVDKHHGEIGPKRLAVILSMAAVPMALVIKQPDIGTALTMGVVLCAVLVVARVRMKYLAILALAGVAGVFFVVHFGILQRYQVQRLTAFLNPNQSALTSGYNLTESKIAIGSGGIWGKGLFKGPQTNLQYVPEQQTDFIFTAVGEQLGFVGAGLLLASFGFVSWRVWRAMRWARDDLGRLVCAGIFGFIVYSIFQNAGMTMGIMPITGIPLPFMSYGGSAALSFFACIGLVLNVGMRRVR